MTLKFIEAGIYRDSRTGNLYHRPKISGKRTARKFVATTLVMARKELSALRTRQLEAKIGLAIDPYAILQTVRQIAYEWQKLGCPDRKGIARTGQSLNAEVARLNKLMPFWKNKEARLITPEDCRDYQSWRSRQSKKHSLGRSVDAELTTLSNLLHWASGRTRKTGLQSNPIANGRPKFYDHAQIRHCTAVMPLTDEDFHRLARHLLSSNRSRALGWQLLLEALTGARTSEMLACRTDANKPRCAGYQDSTALHLDRLKKGIEPWALLEVVPGHTPLAELLLAFRRWHAERHPNCPWFIPGRDGKAPASRLSLTRALKRACIELDIPLVTSHGIRAYFVRTLRSLGVDDSEIAKRLGHRSGVGLVERTYGITEPGWFGSRKLDFVPEGFAAAWVNWLPRKSRKIISLSAYHPPTTSHGTKRNATELPGKSKANKALANRPKRNG